MAKQLVLKDGSIVSGYDNEAEYMRDLLTNHLSRRLKLLLKIPKYRADKDRLITLEHKLKLNWIAITHCSKDPNLRMLINNDLDVLINNDYLKTQMLNLIGLLKSRYQAVNNLRAQTKLKKLDPLIVEINNMESGIVSEPMAHETFKELMKDKELLDAEIKESLEDGEQLHAMMKHEMELDDVIEKFCEQMTDSDLSTFFEKLEDCFKSSGEMTD